jgi:methyl-accepting chemotaxis protein
MAAGNLNIDVPGLQRKDEIGEIARTIGVIRENAVREAIEKQEQATRAEAERAIERKAEMQKLAHSFENAVGEIMHAVTSASVELEASATTLAKTAEITQQSSTMVAAASEQTSSNVQTVASATEEIAASVGEIARQVQTSSQVSNEAVEQARRTDDRITKLSKAANRIGDVTQLITTIAEQTNLLALNATIEAARAGDAGKGFAVVAHEVKQLAAQTAKATQEISGQIAEMQIATQESVEAIKEIDGTIRRVSEIGATIASAMEEQGAATQEIARNVQQAATSTTKVATSISDVSRGATETGSAAVKVLSSAQSLSSESNRLKIELDRFLETVRAA